MNEINQAKKFTNLLLKHAERKSKMYDGSSRNLPIEICLIYIAEEVGEVASEITRDRFLQAEAECLDVAHTAFLLWIALKRKRKDTQE